MRPHRNLRVAAEGRLAEGVEGLESLLGQLGLRPLPDEIVLVTQPADELADALRTLIRRRRRLDGAGPGGTPADSITTAAAVQKAPRILLRIRFSSLTGGFAHNLPLP